VVPERSRRAHSSSRYILKQNGGIFAPLRHSSHIAYFVPMLHAISPIDGRYADKTSALSPYFSESALMRYRCHVEVEYLIALADTGIIPQQVLTDQQKEALRALVLEFNDADADRVKGFESVINHDVKAIEYFIKDKLNALGLDAIKEWVHFGLTSQDINNSAFPLMIKHAYAHEVLPVILDVIAAIEKMTSENRDVAMLARTHGQPASPTRFGKEMMVFVERLQSQLKQVETTELRIKFGGATGNFNAHAVAFPDTDWNAWADTFARKYLGIGRYRYTTQIEHYDQLAALCHATMRINTILIDFCRDVWTYISMNYLTQKVNPNEVGSSAMPHKVNPIDFENAEGNLGYANAIFAHLADKLPISRLQRDLTDSTVLRNIGVPVAHTLIALKSIIKGMTKISVNKATMLADLDANWAILAEALQTILRREGVEQPYELLKKLTRGKATVSKEDLHAFVEQLSVSDVIKAELKRLRPELYTGQ
jgi:adenylosuccinate lyase